MASTVADWGRDVSLRAATAADLDALVACTQRLAWTLEGKRLDAAFVKRAFKALLRFRMPIPLGWVVCTPDGTVVGAIVIGGFELNWLGGLSWLISILYVLPEYEGCGIGNALFQAALRAAQADDAAIGVRLNTHREYPEILAFYERRGMSVDRDYLVLDLEWAKAAPIAPSEARQAVSSGMASGG